MSSNHRSHEKRSDYSIGSYAGPLPALIKKEAEQSAFRLLDSYKSNTGDLKRHQKIYKDFQEIMDLHPLSGCMPLTYDFGVSFKVVIPQSKG
jgi:hypothetical protein